ncbi:MAG: phosphoribosyltransferase family protein [Lysobacterales bacterium]
MTEVAGQRFRLYNAIDLEAVMARMARQTLMLLDPEQPTVVVGVLRRGAPLADRLVAAIATLNPGFRVDRLDLKVKRYSDDLRLLHPETRLDAPEAGSPSVRDRQVLVIDDVLYQGYSLFRVLEFLRAEGASTIRSAVLADRCVARVPVIADVIGVRLQIAPGDVVECSVPPYEAEFAVDVLRPD